MSEKRLNAKLGLDTKEYDRNLKQSKSGMQGFGDVINQVKGFFIGFMAAAGALRGLNKILESTSITSERMAVNMQAAGDATDMLFKSIATGNMANLGDRMWEAAAAGREYAAVMNILAHSQRAVSQEMSKAKIRMSDLEEIFRDRVGRYSPAEQKAALEEYKKLFEDIQTKQAELDKERLSAALDRAGVLTGLAKEEVEGILSAYNNLRREMPEVFDVVKKEMQNSLASGIVEGALKGASGEIKNWEVAYPIYGIWKRMVGTIKGIGDGTQSVADNTKQIREETMALTEEQQGWLRVLNQYGSLNKAQIEDIASAMEAANASEADINAMRIQALRYEQMVINGELRQLAVIEGIKTEMLEMVELHKKIAAYTGPGIGSFREVEPVMFTQNMVPGTEEMISLVNNLESAFSRLFASTGDGLKGMVVAFKDAIAQMAAQLAAKAAIFGILSLIAGAGSGGLSLLATGLMGDKGMLNFMGLPNIGAASVGMGGGGGSLQVNGVLKGSDIHLSNQRRGKLIGRHT